MSLNNRKLVCFVGDTPSGTNIHHDIAFVGSKSFNTLVKWIKFLGVDYYVVLNSDTNYDLEKIKTLHENGFIIVALGNKAAKRLKGLDISFLEFYHPSGLNRKLNSRAKVNEALTELYFKIGNYSSTFRCFIFDEESLKHVR